eukprot:TRINITY_DN3836_c0_g1_i1.p1 TRINITY_DN3836_c0_g1~~TRINITY_DN3836_c0_g1_i1.p1  ORF type:complete len:337 (-),score=137.73 TRINITY_DN3836_c0_g1_i1:88-1098(-)
MATSLFAPVAGAKDSLIEFKAGLMREDSQKWVRPDERKGLVQLKRGADDGLIHFIWKDRNSGTVELDLIIFPEEAQFKKVEEAKPPSRVYLLQFNNGNKRHFFWMQEPKADKDEETIKKFNDYMNNPPEEGSEAGGAAGDMGGLNNQMLMQMLGGMQQTRRGQQSATPSRPAASATPAAAAAAAAPARTNAPAPAAVPGAPPASSQGGDVMRQQLSNLLSGMMPGLQQQREEQAGLTDVLATDQLLQTGILSDPAVRAELEQHLPSIDQGGDLATTLRSPQFRQAVESFNAALASGALPELLASFGLPPSSEASASNLEAFLKAVQQKANKDAEKK